MVGQPPASRKAARILKLSKIGVGGGIACVVLGYLSWFAFQTDARDHPVSEVLWVAITFFLFAGALAVRILTTHEVSVFRRFLGMVADNAVTSYCLMRMGEGGAVI